MYRRNPLEVRGTRDSPVELGADEYYSGASVKREKEIKQEPQSDSGTRRRGSYPDRGAQGRGNQLNGRRSLVSYSGQQTEPHVYDDDRAEPSADEVASAKKRMLLRRKPGDQAGTTKTNNPRMVDKAFKKLLEQEKKEKQQQKIKREKEEAAAKQKADDRRAELNADPAIQLA